MTVVIVSGYFNPLHAGHVRLLKGARAIADKVVVIVNNDRQQLLKKGKIIMTEAERCEVVGALRDVDEVVLSIDQDRAVCQTLEQVARRLPDHKIIFANGGDRDSAAVVPETTVCERYGIEMRFDTGGVDKVQSSSAVNKLLGVE